MIPLHLKLSGFLSYRDTSELEFSSFDLACISGSNGAGKSSLLDAMTWALFGQARKRDEAVINLQSRTAEVAFTFAYENGVYRVLRSLTRGKASVLEFQIAEEGNNPTDPSGRRSVLDQDRKWRPLTERTLRDTQARIEHILRLDYDTFINVSFFLQGRADQFAQQVPARRKEILGAILGLEVWETYRERTGERRKAVEHERESVEGRAAEIEAELAEEQPRKATLAELEKQLQGMVESRKVQEETLANVKLVQAALDKQRDLAGKLHETLERSQANLSSMLARLAAKESERETHTQLVKRADEVEVSYASLQKARLDLEKWEQVAGRFREQDQRRQPLLREIESAKARLEQEEVSLRDKRSQVDSQVTEIVELEAELTEVNNALGQAITNLSLRSSLEKQAQQAREIQAGLRSENTGLKTEMDTLKDRIEALSAADGTQCPLCGQVLSQEHRAATLDQLHQDGSQLGNRWRANKQAMEDLVTSIKDIELRISNFSSAEDERLKSSGKVAQLTERLESLKRQARDWEQNGAKRLAEVVRSLEKESYALQVRKKLAELDKELAGLGYDAAMHDTARLAEQQFRPSEAEYRSLASAQAALRPLDDEIANLNATSAALRAEVSGQNKQYEELATALAQTETGAPDMEAAEAGLFAIQERENQLHQEVGAARQKVSVLVELRKRRKRLETDRSELSLQIGRFKALERAFSKDGVPALLIEQALPEIEMKANQILGRLSDDSMRLHFETQAKYKDEKRKDLRETLEIHVSDGVGMRDYEMYSGGEAFRVNFAIRLALSEVLAQRTGARLQMLVIDEGFGSQDALGRQRLIQAIHAVKDDFAKILVITHLEELKDAFPTRIEVEKTENGSVVQVE